MPALDYQTDMQPAAEEIEPSGRRSQRHRCLLVVVMMPGRTAAEIAAAACMKRHVPSRRLPELRQAGLVTNGVERICGITGNPSTTWYPRPENN